MVTLIFNQRKYNSVKNLLEAQFKDKDYDRQDLFIMTTQEYNKPHKRHKYYIRGDYTLKIDSNRLFIISDVICSIIDLTFESPYLIESKMIY